MAAPKEYRKVNVDGVVFNVFLIPEEQNRITQDKMFLSQIIEGVENVETAETSQLLTQPVYSSQRQFQEKVVPFKWTDDTTKLLLTLVDEHNICKPSQKKTKKKSWQQISEKMNSHGHCIDAIGVSKKWTFWIVIKESLTIQLEQVLKPSLGHSMTS